MRRLALAAVLLLAAWLAVTAFLFLLPREDEVGRADAIIVLSGGKDHRLAEGLRLVARHVAPILVISDGRATKWPRANRLCARSGGGFQVVCFKPDPYSTEGEAQALGRIATRRGWTSLVVVTSTFHVTRARMLFRRCLPIEIDTVGARPPLRYVPGSVMREWGKLLYQVSVDREC